MPTPPKWIDKVNYVVKFWTDPCNAPLLVYLELAAAPAGDAIITWFTFGLDDVLRGYLRPTKQLGKSGFKRRGKRRPKGKKSTLRYKVGRHGKLFAFKQVPGVGDDVGNWIGKRLPGAERVQGIKVGALNKFLWRLDGAGQRVLLALMITNIATDFTYEWATVLDLSEFCQRDSLGSLYATGPGTACGGIIICNSGSAPDVQWKEGNVDWFTALGSVGPRGWTAVLTKTVRNIGPLPVQYYQQSLVSDAARHEQVFSETIIIPPFTTIDSILSIGLVGPGSFTSSHCCFGGVVQPQGAVAEHVVIFGGGNR